MKGNLQEVWKEISNDTETSLRVLTRFIDFCEFCAADVVLDAHCEKGDLLLAISPQVEHVLGITDKAEAYEHCLRKTLGKENINVLQCSVARLPFKREMFSVFVSRFDSVMRGNPFYTIKELSAHVKNKSRLCLQDFAETEDETVNAFFRELDKTIFNLPETMHRLHPSLIEKAGLRIVKQEREDMETSLVWHLGLVYNRLIGIEKINALIRQAFNDATLSKYVYLNKDTVCIRRPVSFIMAIR